MPERTAHYVIIKGEDGQDYVNLVAANGEIVMTSEGHMGHGHRAVGDVIAAAQSAETADVIDRR